MACQVVASDAAAFATSDRRSPAQVLVSPGGPEPGQKVCVVANHPRSPV